MDILILTTLLSPTPLLLSWFTWLKPSTARTRINHDMTYFVRLWAANRDIIRRGNELVWEPGVVERGVGVRAVGLGPRFVERGVGVRAVGVRPGPATATATADPRPTRTRRLSPEEEARRYQEREARRRRAVEAESAREREEERRRAEREKRDRIARENKRGVIVAKVGSGADAERAWVRSRRAARFRTGGHGQRGGGSAWAFPPRSASGPDMEAIWGEMPALGSRSAK